MNARTRPLLPLNCPDCGATFDLLQAMEDADGRRFVDELKELPPLVIKPLIRYLRLFKPAKQGLRWSRLLTLTRELAPMIKSAQVQRNGIIHVVPSDQWAAVMSGLVDTPPRTLSLPLTGNGYLLSILAGQAEQQSAVAERTREEQLRQRGRDGASNGPAHIGDVTGGKRQRKRSSGPPPGWKEDALGRATPESMNIEKETPNG